MQSRWAFLMLAVAAALPAAAPAQPSSNSQQSSNFAVIAGLMPFGVLGGTAAGQAVLGGNFAETAAVHGGTAHQPLLLPFVQQQRQALRDAYITSDNGTELADGLGTTLGDAYQALAPCTSPDYGSTSTCTKAPPAVAKLLETVAALSASDSTAAKFFFADQAASAKAPPQSAPSDQLALAAARGATTDVYGKAYHLPAGAPSADPLGDSRPFQTEPGYAMYIGLDYFGVTVSTHDYLYGPIQNLTSSPSFPSGHTTYGYTESVLLGILVPERYPQMIVRAAEYGNDRIIIGAHYALDVIAGRTLALYDVAHFLASSTSDPAAAGLLHDARNEIEPALSTGCGASVPACAAIDKGRFADAPADAAFYESTQTYGLPPLVANGVAAVEDVGKIAPEAGALLTAAFPKLTQAEADAILTRTEGPGGGFLDDGSAFGIYSRLDMFAATQAAANAAQTT